MSVMRSLAAVLSTVGVAGSMTAAIPPPYHYTGSIWSPFGLRSAHSVSGHALPPAAQAGPSRPKEPGVAAQPFQPVPAAWPAPGSGTAQLPAQPGQLPTAGAASQAGSLPVWI